MLKEGHPSVLKTRCGLWFHRLTVISFFYQWFTTSSFLLSLGFDLLLHLQIVLLWW